MMIEDTLIIECKDNSLAFLQDYSDLLGIEIHPMVEENYIHVHSNDWDTTFINLHNVFD